MATPNGRECACPGACGYNGLSWLRTMAMASRPDAAVHRQVVLDDGIGMQESQCLYAMRHPTTRKILYLGKADGPTVAQRLRCRSKLRVRKRLDDYDLEGCSILVGGASRSEATTRSLGCARPGLDGDRARSPISRITRQRTGRCSLLRRPHLVATQYAQDSSNEVVTSDPAWARVTI
jgi:hypothetical protein